MTASVPLARRAGGPDLARGLALLGIALANLVGWLHGTPWTVLLKQQDATALDRGVDVLLALLVDNRGFPLFAMLFGYGIGILHRRARAAGQSNGRFALRMLRRNAVLLGIGLAHASLLFSGDILVPYAVIGMFCALLVTRRPIALIAAAVITLPVLGVWGWVDGVIGLGGGTGYADASAPDYLTALRLRASEALWGLLWAPLEQIGLLAPMALGALAARARLLEDVDVNRGLLVLIARWGCGLGVLGAVPLTAVLLADPGHAHLESTLVLGSLGVLHQMSGVVGAAGLAAACALLAAHVRTRNSARAVGAADGTASRMLGGSVRAVEALGAVSLSAYLAQSLLGLLVFSPYTLGLGGTLGSAGGAVIVTAGWLVMLPFASVLRRRNLRGPMEHVLRALAGSTTSRPRGGAR